MVYLRWFLVLPAVILGAFVGTSILHFVLMASCGIESTISLPQSGRNEIESSLSGIAAAGGFVSIGARVAPEYRTKTAMILTGALLMTLLLAFAYFHTFQPWGFLANVLGAAWGYGVTLSLEQQANGRTVS